MKNIFLIETHTSVFACVTKDVADELAASINGSIKSVPIVEAKGYEAIDKSGIGYVWIIERYGQDTFACQTEAIAKELAKAIGNEARVNKLPFLKKVD